MATTTDNAAAEAARIVAKAEKSAKASDAARAKARKDELDHQQAVIDAVFDVTHDKDGDPVAIIPPEA